MDIDKYREFLYSNTEENQQTFENKILNVANQMILLFDKAQKEENQRRREEIIFTNSCKEAEDRKGFVMKIQATLYEFTYKEIKNNLSKNILGKVKTDEETIEKTIFSLLEKKRKKK